MAYGNYAPFYRNGYFNPSQSLQMPAYQPIQNEPTQYMPQYQTPSQGISQPVNDMIWVLNENEATAYPVAPNNSVVLWDKNAPTIYVKSVDISGIPSMRILDFTERTAAQAVRSNVPLEQYVKAEEMQAVRQEIEALTARLNEMQEQKTTRTKKTEAENNG